MSPIRTGESSRTIIDILKKGNLELLHSAMIGWMLDKNGEHGLHDTFLTAFVKKTYPNLSSEQFEGVELETAGLKSRYDIKLKLGDKTVIIENKTKSIGGPNQLENYQRANPNAYVVALGFSDISFNTIPQGIPFVKYTDVLNIMSVLKPSGDPNFVTLFNNYRDFLKRELGLLGSIRACLRDAESHDSHVAKVSQALRDGSLRTDNDRRYLNLVALEYLKRYLEERQKWQGTKWVTDKNMQSGVWLANYTGLPDSYTFRPDISDLLSSESQSKYLWYHVELWEGLSAESDESVAGCIQLRCGLRNCADSLKEVVRPLVDRQELVKVVKGGTFYLVRTVIQRKDLVLDKLEAKLTDFMSKFGSFDA